MASRPRRSERNVATVRTSFAMASGVDAGAVDAAAAGATVTIVIATTQRPA